MDSAVNEMINALEFKSVMPWEQRKARQLLREGIALVEGIGDGQNHKVQVMLSKTRVKPFRKGAKRMISIFVDGEKRIGRWASGGTIEQVFGLVYPSTRKEPSQN